MGLNRTTQAITLPLGGMTELELLDVISAGERAFCRDDFPDLDEIDRHLRDLAEQGCVGKVVRAVYSFGGIHNLGRIDVIGELTPLGELRRRELACESRGV